MVSCCSNFGSPGKCPAKWLLPTLVTGGEVKAPAQVTCCITRLKGEVRIRSGASPCSQLIS